MMPIKSCSCGLDLTENGCCESYINTQSPPPHPLALMRSRYTAYVLKKYDYLQKTMQGPALKKFNFDQSDRWSQTLQWEGLSILSYEIKSPTLGYVSFKAYYTDNHKPGVIAEKSEFHKIEDKWYYYDGKALNPHIKPRLAPTAFCLCQSLKEYQNCCGKMEFNG